MAQLFPFRSYRYDDLKIGRIADVVTQPYDKITPEMADRYLRLDPHNVVRVTKNSNYEEASRHLNHWIREGILVQETVPCFYPYEQSFDLAGTTHKRIGFIGLTSLQDSESAVKGHEDILPEPLQDRLSLMRATESNQGPIFMLYSDPSQELDDFLLEFTQTEAPVTEVVDEYDTVNRLWRMSNHQHHALLEGALKNKPLYIADGHHRFQTSVLFFRECCQKGWKPAAVESFDKRLLAAFSMDAPGLTILPTHRGVRNPPIAIDALPTKLEAFFEVTKVGGLHELTVLMRGEGHRIGLAFGKPVQFYLLRVRSEAREDLTFMPGIADPARELDVNILHEGVLRPHLGIGPKELAGRQFVDYQRSAEELIDRLKEGQYGAAFLLNPTRLDQVKKISESGGKMPQKSTDFYPKLLTGLALMKMEIVKGEKL